MMRGFGLKLWDEIWAYNWTHLLTAEHSCLIDMFGLELSLAGNVWVQPISYDC